MKKVRIKGKNKVVITIAITAAMGVIARADDSTLKIGRAHV